MATTHALIGLAVGALSLWVAPEHAPAALVAGLAGGVFPDLDLYAGHRKTLHFPAYYPAAAAMSIAFAAVAGHPAATALAAFLAAAAAHAAMDVLGGGLELRPWEATSELGVYDHWRGVWLAPRRWVRYDGAPEDLGLAGAVGLPLLWVLEGPWPGLVAGILAVSAVYVGLRRPLAHLAERLAAALPAAARRYVPRRFLVEPEPAGGPAWR